MVRKKNNNDDFGFEQHSTPRPIVSETAPEKDEKEKPKVTDDDAKTRSPKEKDQSDTSDMHLYASFKRMLKGLPERKISDLLKKLINPTPKESSKSIAKEKLPTQDAGSGKIPEPKEPKGSRKR